MRLAKLIVPGQSAAAFGLIGRRMPLDVEYFTLRAEIRLRIPVAVETPFHEERRLLKRQQHAVNASMACRAADAFMNVNAVIEIDEAGRVVDALPAQRFARSVAFAHRLQHGAANPNL